MLNEKYFNEYALISWQSEAIERLYNQLKRWNGKNIKNMPYLSNHFTLIYAIFESFWPFLAIILVCSQKTHICRAQSLSDYPKMVKYMIFVTGITIISDYSTFYKAKISLNCTPWTPNFKVEYIFRPKRIFLFVRFL